MKRRVYRNEGFAGQHHVVLPEPLRLRQREHPLLHGLFVTDAGYYPEAAGHFVERKSGAPTHLVILCLRGSGWVRLAGESRPMTAGSCALLPAGRGHAYAAEETDPWTIVWTHFSGDEAAAWAELAFGAAVAGTGGVVAIPPDRLDEVALDRVHAALERGYALRDLAGAAAALRASLAEIARILAAAGGARSARERVVASVEGLRRDWVRPRRLTELAAAAGLSPAHYSCLFREYTGFAPIDYLIRLRVQHACRLLDTSTRSVNEIAAIVGYDDPYYFTRCFRRVMGRAPREYRKVTKG
ncbi:MAG: helix-turn-helix domain-containing protein [Opitutaceae bacterium]|nr:helix-turn-helix domain-containing protein [Opitutaceae bacterium]